METSITVVPPQTKLQRHSQSEPLTERLAIFILSGSGLVVNRQSESRESWQSNIVAQQAESPMTPNLFDYGQTKEIESLGNSEVAGMQA